MAPGRYTLGIAGFQLLLFGIDATLIAPGTVTTEIWGKAEFLNPGQSVKDRAALFIIQSGFDRGFHVATLGANAGHQKTGPTH